MDRLLRWMFEYRYWSLEYRMMCVVDESRNNEVVGFACWKRPEGDISWVERWLYPCKFFPFFPLYVIFLFFLQYRPRMYYIICIYNMYVCVCMYVRDEDVLAIGIYMFGNIQTNQLTHTPIATWFRYLAISIQALRYKYSPGPKIDTTTVEAFMKIMSRIGPTLLNSPRRRAAQYLSMIAVDPTLQGSGLGLALMGHGLAQCEAMEEDVAVVQEQTTTTRRGRASWLIARLGTEAFYERFGFGVVGRMNVDELSHWNGGAIMFRE